MHHEQRQRTHELLQGRAIDRALFANSASVTWLTGFAPSPQTGVSPFSGGPTLIWYESGQFTLIVLSGYADDAALFAAQPNCALVTYQGYTLDAPIDSTTHLTNALRKVVYQSGTKGKLGLEKHDLPLVLWSALNDREDAVSIDGWLRTLRAGKTDEELAKLRENFRLTDIGHAAARAAVQVGAREIDVFSAAHQAIHRAAGRRVPIGNDFIVGHREANIGGWPLDHAIRPGDSFIVDLSTILHGYWSDSCGTYYATEPTPQQRALHKVAADALAFAISLVKPGAVAREIDARVRQFIADAGYPVYPHHTGHGVGVTGHEGPRIVPYNDEVITESMVILLEPGIYLPGETSVRLEDAVLVVADGVEVLTHHDKSI
jgi:Xaa-Pro aminopeptidase